jgi:hypothetical protein
MDPISAKELLKLLETVLDAAKKAEKDDTAERVRFSLLSPPLFSLLFLVYLHQFLHFLH